LAHTAANAHISRTSIFFMPRIIPHSQNALPARNFHPPPMRYPRDFLANVFHFCFPFLSITGLQTASSYRNA
ncbi:MAG: hypothetical protein IKR48_02970, partial [Kiritimatiellae bacterium]|nr:hypothetical protein [Kiritimatiellia bacterium]